MDMIHIVVPGEPVAQGRARITTRNGVVRTYDPRKSADYKRFVRWLANRYEGKPFLGPVVMKVNIYRGVPKSWPKKKQIDALIGDIKPTIKPDISNYLKGIEDALNGIAYVDDSQIVLIIVKKQYDKTPRVEIRIWEDTDENNERFYREGED